MLKIIILNVDVINMDSIIVNVSVFAAHMMIQSDKMAYHWQVM